MGFPAPRAPPTDASPPCHFEIFISAVETGSGFNVVGLSRQHGSPADNIRIVQRVHANPFSGMVEKIDLEIQVPPAFPEKYRDSLIRSAELCAVKKHLENPPQFDITTQVVAPVASAD